MTNIKVPVAGIDSSNIKHLVSVLASPMYLVAFNHTLRFYLTVTTVKNSILDHSGNSPCTSQRRFMACRGRGKNVSQHPNERGGEVDARLSKGLHFVRNYYS